MHLELIKKIRKRCQSIGDKLGLPFQKYGSVIFQ